MVEDFRSGRQAHGSLATNSTAVERVSSVKILGVHLPDELPSTSNTTTIIKSGQQRLHPLWRLKKAGFPTLHMTTFYRCTIESILTYPNPVSTVKVTVPCCYSYCTLHFI